MPERESVFRIRYVFLVFWVKTQTPRHSSTFIRSYHLPSVNILVMDTPCVKAWCHLFRNIVIEWLVFKNFSVCACVISIHWINTLKFSECHFLWCIGGEFYSWWRHQMETFSALLAICAGNSPVPVNSPHKVQWRGALMFSLICAWINRLSKQS